MGQNYEGTIQNSYAAGDVNGGDGDSDRVGGLVGENYEGTIQSSYAAGNADGGDGDGDSVGGLVGENFLGTIGHSYATGNADGGAGNYDRVGGLVGRLGSARIRSSYYNSEARIRGETPNTFGQGKTPGELQALTATSRGWSEYDWDFGTSGTHYPSVLSTSGTLLCAQPGQGTTRVGQPGTCP